MSRIRDEHARGHALTLAPRRDKIPAYKCQDCGGNAIARGICQICFKPLCGRHTIKIDGVMYCGDCRPGYRSGVIG